MVDPVVDEELSQSPSLPTQYDIACSFRQCGVRNGFWSLPHMQQDRIYLTFSNLRRLNETEALSRWKRKCVDQINEGQNRPPSDD